MIIATGGAAGAAMLALVSIRAGTLFGVGSQLDAYFVAVSVPSLLLALSASVVTAVLTPRLAVMDGRMARRRAGEWALLTFLMASVLAALIALFSHTIVSGIAPGLSDAGSQTAAKVLRIMALALPETMATHVYSAYGYANGRVYAGGVSTAAYGLMWLVLLFLSPFTHSVQGVAIACVVATQIQLAISFGLCAPLRLAPWPRWRIPDHPLVPIVAASAVLLTLLMSKINLLLDPLFGSFLKHGDVSDLSYAYRIALLFILVAGQGSALTLLAIKPEEKGYPTDLHKLGMGITVLLAVGAGTVVAVCFRPVATLILAHGSLAKSDALAIGGLVQAYAGLVIAMSIAWSFESSMYAAHRVWTVTALNVPVVLLNIGLSILLVSTIGVYGRPLAVTISMVLYLVLLIGVIEGRAAFRSMVRSLPWRDALGLGSVVGAMSLALVKGGQATGGSAGVWGMASMLLSTLMIIAYVRNWLKRMATPYDVNSATKFDDINPTVSIAADV